MTPEAELAKLMGRIEQAGRGIVLLHDTKAETARMLPALLRALKKGGYHIVHVVPAAGWRAVN
jgi:peptidoglycan/xylan/chitin deacetylase (PgdA/CDA1 family)